MLFCSILTGGGGGSLLVEREILTGGGGLSIRFEVGRGILEEK